MKIFTSLLESLLTIPSTQVRSFLFSVSFQRGESSGHKWIRLAPITKEPSGKKEHTVIPNMAHAHLFYGARLALRKKLHTLVIPGPLNSFTSLSQMFFLLPGSVRVVKAPLGLRLVNTENPFSQIPQPEHEFFTQVAVRSFLPQTGRSVLIRKNTILHHAELLGRSLNGLLKEK